VNRVRGELSNVKGVEEKKMFGGVGFMVNGKLCVCARDSRITIRINPRKEPELLSRKGCSPMTSNGRRYPGFLFVDSQALKSGRDLKFWVGLALEHNLTIT